MMTVLIALAALFVGAALGMFVMSLCVMGTRSDRRFESNLRAAMEALPETHKVEPEEPWPPAPEVKP